MVHCGASIKLKNGFHIMHSMIQGFYLQVDDPDPQFLIWNFFSVFYRLTVQLGYVVLAFQFGEIVWNQDAASGKKCLFSSSQVDFSHDKAVV